MPWEPSDGNHLMGTIGVFVLQRLIVVFETTFPIRDTLLMNFNEGTLKGSLKGSHSSIIYRHP